MGHGINAFGYLNPTGFLSGIELNIHTDGSLVPSTVTHTSFVVYLVEGTNNSSKA